MERPILFSAPMVRALLAGTKTVTRRLFKPRHDAHIEDGVPFFEPYVYAEPKPIQVPCPYGEPGDRLWVKETHSFMTRGRNRARKLRKHQRIPRGYEVVYRADEDYGHKAWKPSIFMQRKFSRITLDVVSVRVERLLDITDEDAKREGVRPFFEIYDCIGRDQRITDGKYARDEEYRASFACLWDEINGDRALWNTNPWVWRVEFELVEAA